MTNETLFRMLKNMNDSQLKLYASRCADDQNYNTLEEMLFSRVSIATLILEA